MSDSYILSNMLRPLVKELSDKDIEYIRNCLPIDGNNRDVVKMNPEYSGKDGINAIMDNVYKIPDADALFSKVETMTLTLDEEYAHTIICDAIDEKKVVTMEAYIDSFVAGVKRLVDAGFDMDSAMLSVPDDIRDEVRSRLD